MPVITRQRRGQRDAQQRGRQPRSSPARVPFVMAAHEHTEPMIDVTVVPGASAIQLGPYDVPASGFLRNLFLDVQVSGGTLGAGALSQDYPFNWLGSVQLLDTNGAWLCNLDGYSLAWANIIGAPSAHGDPRRAPNYVGTINARFKLRIPSEISHRNGYGSLGNQNSAAAYKLLLVVNPQTVPITSAPTTYPTAIRIRTTLEAWTQPASHDSVGRAQEPVPPGHGLMGGATTQYWSYFTHDVAVGNQTILLPKVGNLIRNLVIIGRDNASPRARSDAVVPDPLQFQWDNVLLRNESQFYNIDYLFDHVAGLTARDTGVFAFTFGNQDKNTVGDDLPDLWIATTQADRLEIDGPAAASGQLTILTNDIAPYETDQAERYDFPSGTNPRADVGAVAGVEN